MLWSLRALIPAFFLLYITAAGTPQLDPMKAYSTLDECLDAAEHKSVNPEDGDKWKAVVCLNGYLMR